jgi:hypothetical protein
MTNPGHGFWAHNTHMPENSVFHDWRTADKEAHAQEMLMATASLRAMEGKGASPSTSEREKARTLRQSADTLFQGAMQEFRQKISLIRGS